MIVLAYDLIHFILFIIHSVILYRCIFPSIPPPTHVARTTRWKSEAECGRILAQLFPKWRWRHNDRPFWNKSPHSDLSLELDYYCEEHAFALEYQGIQHYRPITFFDGEDKEQAAIKFRLRKERDKAKRINCTERGVYLLEVPYNIKDRKTFILNDPKVKEKQRVLLLSSVFSSFR